MDKMIEKACDICGLFKRYPGFNIAVNFVDTETICRINREFVGHEGTTDVISFNYAVEGEPCTDYVSAELFICTDTAAIVSRKLKKNFYDEIALYIVHGILHVAGEDDFSASDKKRMRRLERNVLSELRKTFDFSVIFPEVKAQ